MRLGTRVGGVMWASRAFEHGDPSSFACELRDGDGGCNEGRERGVGEVYAPIISNRERQAHSRSASSDLALNTPSGLCTCASCVGKLRRPVSRTRTAA